MNPNSYLVKNLKESNDLKKVATRDGYGEGLVLAGEENENVVVLSADLTKSTRSHLFKEKFPERFIEVGVAEQNMASLASGMASEGKIPFISSYAVFSPGRNNEQIRTTISYNNANVKIAGAHAGISVGPDGATHQSLEDISLMRVQPSMTVVASCDAEETKKATLKSSRYNGPVYLRFARNKTPVFTTFNTPFEIGRAEVFKDGKDTVIIGCGPLLYNGLKSALELEEEGVSVAVINSHTIKPLDEETILEYVRKTGAVVSIEEHQVSGGLGGAISELLAKENPTPIEFIGVKDSFGESGEPEELINKYGLGVESIKKAVKKVISRK